MKLFFILLISSITLEANMGGISCTYTEICQKMLNEVPKPQYLRNDFDSKAAADSELTLQSQRIEKIFNHVRKKVIGLIQERRLNLNQTEIQNLISRVESIKLLDHYTEIKKQDSLALQSCNGPNAFYLPYSHSITFCPQIFNWPDASIEMLAAHEIAHSFDPCAISKVVLDIENGKRLLTTKDTIIFLQTKSTPYLAPISVNRSPFYSEVTCLATTQQQGRQILPNIENIVNLTGQSYTKTTFAHASTLEYLMDITKVEYPMRHKAIQKYYQNYKYCADFSGYSLVAEGFADWIATSYVAGELRNLKDLPAQDQFRYALDAFGVVGNRCQTDLKETSGRESRFHISNDLRMSEIFLARSEIQEALGCAKNEVPKCGVK